uniref:Pro-corazonin n=1 Tax=Timema cristinae TaxID=61476 RepID=A0A7R9HA43_TIMCR|nr:unnamed protein product [Timema cristinae]
MTCPRSSRVPVLLILLSCLTGIILAQTFQYSRGWTNGRKRGFVVPRAPVIVAEETLPSSEGGEGSLSTSEDEIRSGG